MKSFKPILFILYLLLSSLFCFAQQQEIVKILNQELKKEIRRQQQMPNFDGDTLVLVQPYRLNGHVLSVAVRRKNYSEDKYYTEKQEVALDKITTVVKDINVIFETETDAVTITDSTGNATGLPDISTRKYNLFFLHLSYEKQNEALAAKLIKAFKKAGYIIEKRFWAD